MNTEVGDDRDTSGADLSDVESLNDAIGGGQSVSSCSEEEEHHDTLQFEELVPCRCQQIYKDSGNDKKTLYLLCIGLNASNSSATPLLSLDDEPWLSLPKSSLRPKKNDFGKEISRRANLYNVLPVPRPTNWKRHQIIEWLEQNPIREYNCIQFLRCEVAKLRDILARVQQQEADLSSASRVRTNWRGTVPYLCVILCLTDDNVKRLFLNRANARTRQELDGRNSEHR
jgi:hypothetical protein